MQGRFIYLFKTIIIMLLNLNVSPIRLFHGPYLDERSPRHETQDEAGVRRPIETHDRVQASEQLSNLDLANESHLVLIDNHR